MMQIEIQQSVVQDPTFSPCSYLEDSLEVFLGFHDASHTLLHATGNQNLVEITRAEKHCISLPM